MSTVSSLLLKALPLRAGTDPYASAPQRRLSEADWMKKLPANSFEVLRHGATEPANSSPLTEEHRRGTFSCLGCGLALFSSDSKFDSGTGWPNFYQVIEGAVVTKLDHTGTVERTEYHCARCLGHQGVLYADGPQPWGLRYCNNGVALTFAPT